MSPEVTDLSQARAKRENSLVTLKREPLTVICQVSNVRAEAEVHRQIGFSDAFTFAELHRVLEVSFGLPDEDSPWHFYEHRDARGSRIDPEHQVSEFLWKEGDQVDYVWGLWDFSLVVAEIYPRDTGTPEALCVGGSGSFLEPFDLTAINAELTGQETIDEVLNIVVPPVRAIIERTKLFDFVPLLQALDLERPESLELPENPESTDNADTVRAGLDSLPREVTSEGQDAFWSMTLGLSCMGGRELTNSVAEATMEALGWLADDGASLSGEEIRELCAASLEELAAMGGYGADALAPVDRLDIYRALLRR
ncbi:hypothetical protein CBE89_00350 [Corynebacterium striatum]|uniref:Uncharacterized protein n=1 Tax=Corynebacterium striatum TaxID=43770 RepID=A0A2Z2IWM7_CORST|nr:hypothetical protein CBE89_00350 [Corynebacterium striatum]